MNFFQICLIYNYIALYDVSRFRIGNKHLEPEKGYSIIGGFEHDFGEKSGMTLSFFQNKLKNYLDRDVYRGAWIYLLAGNHIPIESRGIELTFRQNIDDHFSYNLGYSHTHSDFKHPIIGDVPLYRSQQNGYRIGLNYNNRGLNASLPGIMASGLNTDIGKFWSNTDVIYSYTTKRYVVFNLKLMNTPQFILKR